MTTDPDHDHLITLSTLSGAVSTARATVGPVTTLIRRLAWQTSPRVELRYHADGDILLVRFAPLITAHELVLSDRLYVGLDHDGDDPYCSTMCLAGFVSEQTGRAPYVARLVLGDRVWSRARAVAAEGSGDETILLDPGEAADLTHTWSMLIRDGTPSADSTFQVDVIPVSDSQLREILTQWSAEIIRADQARPSAHRGLRPALHHGISGLRAVAERDIGKPNASVGGEWERPDLANIGVHPRLAWRVEPGNPPILVIRAAPLLPDADVRPDTGRRMEVRLGDGLAMRAEFTSDGVGALAARIKLPAVGRVLRGTGPRHVTVRYAAKRGRWLLVRGVHTVRRVVPHWASRRT